VFDQTGGFFQEMRWDEVWRFKQQITDREVALPKNLCFEKYVFRSITTKRPACAIELHVNRTKQVTNGALFPGASRAENIGAPA
jgi:hypothetical protein